MARLRVSEPAEDDLQVPRELLDWDWPHWRDPAMLVRWITSNIGGTQVERRLE